MTAFEQGWNLVKDDPDDGPMEEWPSQQVKDFEQDEAQSYMNGIEEVRDLVQQGMEVMPAVREVARLLGLDGRTLFGIYVRAYR